MLSEDPDFQCLSYLYEVGHKSDHLCEPEGLKFCHNVFIFETV